MAIFPNNLPLYDLLSNSLQLLFVGGVWGFCMHIVLRKAIVNNINVFS